MKVMKMIKSGRPRSVRKGRIRDTMKINCPKPGSLGCEDFKCKYDPNVCGTECLEEVVPCIMCENREDCIKPVRDQLIYIYRTEETKKELLEMHDEMQDEILEIIKYWKSMKIRQKWTVKEKMKDMTGQLKGLRYALHKLGVPFYPKYLTGMKIEDTALAYWKEVEESDEEEH